MPNPRKRKKTRSRGHPATRRTKKSTPAKRRVKRISPKTRSARRKPISPKTRTPRRKVAARRERQVRQKIRVSRQKGYKSFSGPWNLCLSADREDFYQQIQADRRELRDRLSDEDYSALKVVVEVEPPSGAARESSKFYGTRTFGDMRKLQMFLRLEAQPITSGQANRKRSMPNWGDKRGLCRFDKKARLVIKPLHPRKRVRVFRKYSFE